MVENRGLLAIKNPELKKAVGVLKELSADERTRMIAEDREKARRNEASRLEGARREGKIEVAQKLPELNMPIDKITEATDLTTNEIESLV